MQRRMRLPTLLLWCLVACALLAESSGSVLAAATVSPTVTPTRVTPLSVSTSSSTAASDSDSRVGTDRTTSVNATEVTAILDKIGADACAADTRAIISTIFSANSVLLDACLKESGYMLFPYAGYFPRQGQTSKVCASPSCMDLLSGIVLAKLPDCAYDKYNPRSLAESFFRVRVDLANGRSPPTTTEFTELYDLNKVLNLLKENTTLQATIKPSFSISAVTQSMNPAEINPDVVLGENYVIYVQASSGSAATTGDSSSESPSPSTSGSSNNSNSKSPTVGTSGLTPTADTTSDGAKPNEGKLSVSYFFIGFAWVVFNGSYFILMSHKD
ncbi:Elicitin [Globisporangium polare]